MVEKKILVDDLRMQYTGLFDVTELYRLFDELIHERGYVKLEKKSDQFMTKHGRQIYLEIRPVKEFEQDFLSTIKIRIKMNDVKDVVLEVNGAKKQYNQGNLLLIFDGWTTTFYEFAWETKPVFVFLRMLVDKYIYKVSFGKYEGEIINDVHYIYDRVKAHLNLHRYAGDTSQGNKANKEMVGTDSSVYGTSANPNTETEVIQGSQENKDNERQEGNKHVATA
ncbi:TPA: hypothetical protein HA246_05450 [Candidatus Woesearchaeota archaeon]|nr:hypothetical protein [Candidatus Woesearchaeota archaeon]